MKDTITCKYCGQENAYFDEVVYSCPDCDAEQKWDDEKPINVIENAINNIDYQYELLIEVPEPFFRLKHGVMSMVANPRQLVNYLTPTRWRGSAPRKVLA